MSTIEVVEVESSSQLDQFIAYPNELYKDDPYYVAHLTAERKDFFDTKKNPFFKAAKAKLFLAMEGDKVCGRIATCVNYRHNKYHEENTGFFGFFDTPDNQDISSRLLKVAMITLKKEGMERMRGPMNFSTNHEIGFLVEGFDSSPMIMMTYNKPYQPVLAEKFGLKKVMDLLAYRLHKDNMQRDRAQAVANRLIKRANLKIRTLRMSEFWKEAARIREVYNSAWAQNWGFVPMDEIEFNWMAKNLKQIVDPKLVLIAEYEGKPVAFSLSLPDVNRALKYLKGRLYPFGLLKLLWHTKIRNKVNAARVLTLGIVPEYRGRGIESIMYLKTAEYVTGRGYDWGEFSWVLESNTQICHGLEQIGSTVYKRYRIMQMPL